MSDIRAPHITNQTLVGCLLTSYRLKPRIPAHRVVRTLCTEGSKNGSLPYENLVRPTVNSDSRGLDSDKRQLSQMGHITESTKADSKVCLLPNQRRGCIPSRSQRSITYTTLLLRRQSNGSTSDFAQVTTSSRDSSPRWLSTVPPPRSMRPEWEGRTTDRAFFSTKHTVQHKAPPPHRSGQREASFLVAKDPTHPPARIPKPRGESGRICVHQARWPIREE